MYAVTGITGKVGGAVANALLDAGQFVRAIVREPEKAKPWIARGCATATATVNNPEALARAFTATDGVFLMTPPNYDPEPAFPDTLANASAIRTAIETARPARVVFLSTVGAHVSESNLLNNSRITEEMLRSISVPVALLRAAWFMENASWDAEGARTGTISSFLQPLAHAIPMVAIQDIGGAVAELLQSTWSGLRVVELEGPRRYSAADVGAAFSQALGRDVRVEAVPRERWETIFRQQGAHNPLPRMRMLDGFNEGWIDFEGGRAEHRKGVTTLDEVISRLLSMPETT
jgi:NAD(P)H dehydrogenase (quinone)